MDGETPHVENAQNVSIHIGKTAPSAFLALLTERKNSRSVKRWGKGMQVRAESGQIRVKGGGQRVVGPDTQAAAQVTSCDKLQRVLSEGTVKMARIRISKKCFLAASATRALKLSCPPTFFYIASHEKTRRSDQQTMISVGSHNRKR